MPLTYLLILLAQAAPAEPQTAVVAVRKLPPGTVIGEDDIEEVPVPPAAVAHGMLRNAEQALGRVVKDGILQGDLVRDERLAEPDLGTGLNALVPEGQRLVRVALAEPSPARPWSWVDVLRVRGTEACLLAENVRVLAAEGPDGSPSTDPDRAVPGVALHLAAGPAEAGALGATDPTEVAIVERGVGDTAPADPAGPPRCDVPRPAVVVGQAAVSGAGARAALKTVRPGERWAGPATGELLLVVTGGSGRIEVGGTTAEVSAGTTLSVSLPAELVFQGAGPLELVQVVVPPR